MWPPSPEATPLIWPQFQRTNCVLLFLPYHSREATPLLRPAFLFPQGWLYKRVTTVHYKTNCFPPKKKHIQKSKQTNNQLLCEDFGRWTKINDTIQALLPHFHLISGVNARISDVRKLVLLITSNPGRYIWCGYIICETLLVLNTPHCYCLLRDWSLITGRGGGYKTGGGGT